MGDAEWDYSILGENRNRLLAHNAVIELFNETLETAQTRGYVGSGYFRVDYTLVEVWSRGINHAPKNQIDDDTRRNNDAG